MWLIRIGVVDGSHGVRTFECQVCERLSAVQLNPAHSISHMLLAAALAKLGRLKEAEMAGARVWNCSRRFVTAGSSPVWIARPRLPHLSAMPFAPSACRNNTGSGLSSAGECWIPVPLAWGWRSERNWDPTVS